MPWSKGGHASWSARLPPPGRPKTSVTPSASRQRMIASAPVILCLSTGHHPIERVVGKLRSTAGVVGEGVADRLPHLPGRVRPPPVHLIGGGETPRQHLVDGCADRPADVAAAEAVREHH